MSKALVLYWSGTGNTEMLATAVAEGIKLADVDVDLLEISEFDINTINDYSHVALGCPSMGDEQLEEYEFQPVYDDFKDDLENKNVALFGSYDWGNGEWMDAWNIEVITLGANLIQDGLIVNLYPEADDLKKAEDLGNHLANS